MGARWISQTRIISIYYVVVVWAKVRIFPGEWQVSLMLVLSENQTAEKCQNRSWLKREKNMETCPQTLTSKNTRQLPKVSLNDTFFPGFKNILITVAIYIYVKKKLL